MLKHLDRAFRAQREVVFRLWDLLHQCLPCERQLTWLADLSHWFIVWDVCRDAPADGTALNLTVMDQAGQAVGDPGSSPNGSGAVWVVSDDLAEAIPSLIPRS
ncbi:hypothetical protein [uncultured Thiocystis sp.]|uniref:hypothetical protein n=1 Tax=uncultured Thiocystis sp. TaxID=1202134 RepID=UPI0025FAE432|nr:hypothetical protein [uncultured Thiocystis sp.]